MIVSLNKSKERSIMKKSFLLLFPLIAGGLSLYAKELSSPSESIEIIIRINRPCPEDDCNREVWDKMVEDVCSVASSCQGCTSRTFEPMVDALSSCIKAVGKIMNTDPDVRGEISITVKDDLQQGFMGQIRRDN
jgi:hypothetical protein